MNKRNVIRVLVIIELYSVRVYNDRAMEMITNQIEALDLD